MLTESLIWITLKSKGLTCIAIAGILGNLFAESSLHFNNVQDGYEKITGGDSYYTQAVDSGSYSKYSFINDDIGYGIAQWTTSDRKEKLYNKCKEKECSIADQDCQLELLYEELQEFDLITKLNNTNTVQEASDIILIEYAKPKNQGQAVKNYRGSIGLEYYNQLITEGGKVK